MRIFSLLALIIVLAILMFQYSNNIKQSGYGESGAFKTEEVEKQVNDSVSKYQKKLEDSLKQSGVQE